MITDMCQSDKIILNGGGLAGEPTRTPTNFIQHNQWVVK